MCLKVLNSKVRREDDTFCVECCGEVGKVVLLPLKEMNILVCSNIKVYEVVSD